MKEPLLDQAAAITVERLLAAVSKEGSPPWFVIIREEMNTLLEKIEEVERQGLPLSR